ncbi:hypothetical protein DERP_009725 [Dermatophagoides pteronyssinus]|uniref:Uncharacterized protein n=1 Tax=Dermatophagoides pteronyssinus TaxID=6956 RepID=A0ABQ8IQZ8_DERPT|nr:hypothetical protein DERP_009725 [Dermatophagoides pteronyssinus]
MPGVAGSSNSGRGVAPESHAGVRDPSCSGVRLGSCNGVLEPECIGVCEPYDGVRLPEYGLGVLAAESIPVAERPPAAAFGKIRPSAVTKAIRVLSTVIVWQLVCSSTRAVAPIASFTIPI